ncbi:MAG: SseB family protein [Abitibacteriaceae bacterium]|nr:SseB family protein [Abditibacteriaceae bacterium]
MGWSFDRNESEEQPALEQAAPEQSPLGQPTAAPAENAELVALIHDMKLDTLMGDMRPMHRAILTSPLLLPLHEPPHDGRLRYITFNDDSTMCVFTDEAHLRAFCADMANLPAQVAVVPVSGAMLCAMAMRGELALLAINPHSNEHYAMPPHVFRVLAHDYVPSSVADSEIRSQQMVVARPLSGLPSQEELQAWHVVLAQNGATAAFWFNLLLEDVQELRYAIGVECAPEQFETLQSKLVQAWFGKWPVNTPLWVQHLSLDEVSQGIRQGGTPIYP